MDQLLHHLGWNRNDYQRVARSLASEVLLLSPTEVSDHYACSDTSRRCSPLIDVQVRPADSCKWLKGIVLIAKVPVVLQCGCGRGALVGAHS